MEVFLPTKNQAVLPGQDNEEANLTKGAVLRGRILGFSSDSGLTSVKIGARVIQAQLSQYLEPGRDVRLMVEQTSPKLVLAPVQDPETRSSPAPTRAAGPPLENNQILAKVIDLPEKGKIRLSITDAAPNFAADRGRLSRLGAEIAPGREVTASLAQSAGLNLQPGDEIKFNVTENLSRLFFHPAPNSNPSRPPLAQALAAFLAEPTKLPEGAALFLALTAGPTDSPPRLEQEVQALRDLAAALSPQPGKVDNEFLGRIMDLLGFTGEKSRVQAAAARLWTKALEQPLLEDLKTNQRLLTFLETAAKVFEAVGQAQDLNKETIGQSQTLHLAFPIFWPNENGRGEILASWDRGREKKNTEKTLRVSLLLDLTKLGRTKIDLELSGKKARGQIFTETLAAKTAVSGRLGNLKQSLEARGFVISSLAVETYPPKTRPPETLAAELLPQGRGLIDVKV
ncbi:MAG: flagellar hook-length control protein FliK [Pseudomonadota bacterium]